MLLPASAPPLAGLCSYPDAASADGSVEDAVRFLRRLARIERRTLLVLAAHLNAVPEWELKLIRSRTTHEVLTGVYAVLKPNVIADVEHYIERANPLAEQPTLRCSVSFSSRSASSSRGACVRSRLTVESTPNGSPTR